ncbi:hypothetical protein BD413DRAFT_57249 [Trametes elegans]|nr:hypothetical protein BD413DRAFT_57249 [Trametes elegans]
MLFQTRNAYYLRISTTTVIPLYLYLDERHVDWMSERVLQHVLSDLRPLILPKLNAEVDAQVGPGGPANAKRGTLDVHRGDTYQFGYFLRGTEPHAVLIKASILDSNIVLDPCVLMCKQSRTFTATPQPAPRAAAAPSSSTTKPQKSTTSKTSKKRKPKPKPRPKGKGKARADDDAISISSEDEANADDDESAEPLAMRRSKRARKAASGGYAEDVEDNMDEDMPGQHRDAEDEDFSMVVEQLGQNAPVTLKHEEAEPSLADLAPEPEEAEPTAANEGAPEFTMDVELVEDEEEAKPKPVLKLSYHGFTIHGRCLCVIVEPYPPLRSGTRAPSLVPTGLIAPRAPSIAPPDFIPSGGVGQRERTPLFLPDFDRELTPAPAPARSLPQVPLFSETAGHSDDEDEEDDDDIDGAVFFGDADEMREL